MYATFRGEDVHKVDTKGRVSIPAQFRRVIEAGDPGWESGQNPGLVIVYGDDRRNYLECFTIESIGEVDAKIKKLPRGSAKRRALQRLYNGQATHVSVDETGRLVLAKKLRDKIGLAESAMFVGNGDTFEIWKPETYDAALGPAAGDEDFDPDLDPSVYLEGEDF